MNLKLYLIFFSLLSGYVVRYYWVSLQIHFGKAFQSGTSTLCSVLKYVFPYGSSNIIIQLLATHGITTPNGCQSPTLSGNSLRPWPKPPSPGRKTLNLAQLRLRRSTNTLTRRIPQPSAAAAAAAAPQRTKPHNGHGGQALGDEGPHQDRAHRSALAHPRLRPR
jgi:hypothetical protein